MMRLDHASDWEGPASNLSCEVVQGCITAKALCVQNGAASSFPRVENLKWHS